MLRLRFSIAAPQLRKSMSADIITHWVYHHSTVWIKMDLFGVLGTGQKGPAAQDNIAPSLSHPSGNVVRDFRYYTNTMHRFGQ